MVVNGAWNAIATQLKFVLAIISSTFGGCFPIVMVTSQLCIVGVELLLSACGEVYSNVHSVSGLNSTWPAIPRVDTPAIPLGLKTACAIRRSTQYASVDSGWRS